MVKTKENYFKKIFLGENVPLAVKAKESSHETNTWARRDNLIKYEVVYMISKAMVAFFIAFIVNKRAHGRKSEQFIFAVSINGNCFKCLV